MVTEACGASDFVSVPVPVLAQQAPCEGVLQCCLGFPSVSPGDGGVLSRRRELDGTDIAVAVPINTDAGIGDDALELQPLATGTSAPLGASHTGDPVTTMIYAAGVCCPMEIPLVNKVLYSLPGVLEVETAVITKTVRVVHWPGQSPPSVLLAALNAAHLQASMHTRGGVRPPGKRWRLWVPPWYSILSAALLVISLLSVLADVGVGEYWQYFEYVALGSVAISGPLIVWKALISLRHGMVDINLLMAIAAVGAIALQMYCEAGAVVVLFVLADHLETCCTAYARNALMAVTNLRPQKAVLAEDGRTVQADSLVVGDVVLVRPGDAVPVDGEVIKGCSTVDESMLTGEPAAVPKAAGGSVYGGTINSGAQPLQVRATAVAADSAVSRVASLVEQAAVKQSPLERTVTQFAKYFTPLVIVSALAVAVIPIAVGKRPAYDWIYLGLQVLVTACPCALVLSTPATVVSALARAAQQGVLLKGGGECLERLAGVRVVALDKTGTVTEGHFRVMACEMMLELPRRSPKDSSDANSHNNGANMSPLCPLTELQLLRLLASLERHSSHPLASAVIGYAASRGVAADAPVKGCTVVPGQGLVGVVDGRSLLAGNWRLMAAMDVAAPCEGTTASALIAHHEASGSTLCYVAVDGELTALLPAADGVRPGAAAAVAHMRRSRLRSVMLTGDCAASALAVARQVGLAEDDVHAQLLPEDKLELVERYRARYGPLCHVGDGINDAPALAAADVGIAMGSVGTAVAVEAADVALFTEDLGAVPAVVGLGKAARRKIFENVAFSVVTKVVVLVLASLRLTPLWVAVAVDVGTALAVIANGMTMLLWSRGGTKEGCVAQLNTSFFPPADVTAASSACTKGCCGSGGVAAQGQAAAALDSGTCTKGCCGSGGAAAFGQAAAALDSVMCTKGCCGSGGVAAPGQAATALDSGTPACADGCCPAPASDKAVSNKACSDKCSGAGGLPLLQPRACPKGTSACSKGNSACSKATSAWSKGNSVWSKGKSAWSKYQRLEEQDGGSMGPGNSHSQHNGAHATAGCCGGPAAAAPAATGCTGKGCCGVQSTPVEYVAAPAEASPSCASKGCCGGGAAAAAAAPAAAAVVTQAAVAAPCAEAGCCSKTAALAKPAQAKPLGNAHGCCGGAADCYQEDGSAADAPTPAAASCCTAQGHDHHAHATSAPAAPASTSACQGTGYGYDDVHASLIHAATT